VLSRVSNDVLHSPETAAGAQAEQTLRNIRVMNKYFSESLGTFALVFAGTGAIVINEVTHGTVSHPGIALTFGLVVLAMIYTFGDISGAHLNPAVTTAFAVAGRLPWRIVPGYIVAQLLGGMAASGLLRLLFPTNALLGSTHPAGSGTQSLVLEAVLTFLLMLVILNVSTGAKEKGITAGIAIGSVIGLEAMFAGPISGASMNPARSIAPALVSGHLDLCSGAHGGRSAGRACVLPCSRARLLQRVRNGRCFLKRKYEHK
jgi:aquaporin NIP